MKARLIESVELARDVRQFTFEAIGVERLAYEPGQFVALTETIDGKPITRAYSLASAPDGGNRFELCLNRVEDGLLSPHLFAMRSGDEIEMREPLGGFTLRDAGREAILIATGTGVVPFRSYLQAYLAQGRPPFTLLFGVRFESHMLYRSEFEEMAQTYPQFRFWPTLTRPDENWRGRVGRVQTHLEEAIGDKREVDFYLCGMKEMVDQIRVILKDKGYDRKQIRYEKYD
jgi:CDP-4-dehydro-6-deoxyglucose reductase